MNKEVKSLKILNNSILLYIRMAFVAIVNLYIVRLVLNALGLEDYGIYNVVAGVVSMLSVITTSLSTSTQRFYSYSLGNNDKYRLKQVFSVSITLYIILAIIVIILGETIGIWFVNTHLSIPNERINAANTIFHISLLTFAVNIMQVPYSAAVIANEDMGVFAIVSITNSLLKLIFAFLLFKIFTDRLVFYAISLLVVEIYSFFFYFFFGRKNYSECYYEKISSKNLFKEIGFFSGWTMFSSLASIGVNQVTTVIINIFFGPIVTSARAISIQIQNAINSFSSSFITAVRPPMVKSYADGSYDYLNKVFYFSNKFILYLLLVFCIPLFFEMESILLIWLKTNDPLVVLFSKLTLVYVVFLSLNNPIGIIVQATGNVKMYNLIVESVMLLSAPTTYILFKFGYPSYYAIISMIIFAVLAHGVRLICLKKIYPQFEFFYYFKSFFLPGLLISLITALAVYFIHDYIQIFYIRLISTLIASVIIIGASCVVFGLSDYEKKYLKKIITKLIRKNG